MTPLNFKERLEFLGLLIFSEHLIAVDCWYPGNSGKYLKCLVWRKTLVFPNAATDWKSWISRFFLILSRISIAGTALGCLEGLESFESLVGMECLDSSAVMQGLESLEGF